MFSYKKFLLKMFCVEQVGATFSLSLTILFSLFQLLNLSQKVLGKKLFALSMKASFYGHFVAGELKEDIKPKISTMEKFGVGAILDYAVEADVPSFAPDTKPKT